MSLQDSGQPIPLVVESCVRYINLYGESHDVQPITPGFPSLFWSLFSQLSLFLGAPPRLPPHLSPAQCRSLQASPWIWT